MTIERYADILKLVMQTQIHYIEEELEKPFADEEYLNGTINGLRIAIDKINASMFLAE
jgi:hypothetical protein